MSLLPGYQWRVKYDSDVDSLLKEFYEPALESAVRYDRATGYFSAGVLTLAARGIERLVRNEGRMRLVVGCTLDPPEVEAIEEGSNLRDTVAAHILVNPLKADNPDQTDALELLAWMVAKGHLEVKVAVPCDAARRPAPAFGIFHEKAGTVEDKAGNRIAFNGSVNETPSGWTGNWESFHVFLEWTGDKPRVEEEEASFSRLWAGRARRALVVDIPQAVRDDLLKFLPKDDAPPRRIRELGAPYSLEPVNADEGQPQGDTPGVEELRRLVWGIIEHAPSLPDGGERVGEATANVTPWPHQVRAFERLYNHWPPKLLIADEVGLGKTIEVGLLLRQAWLSGRAKRILILAPKAVLTQWQIELREKFNLNWPIYDGQQLLWYPSPAKRHGLTRKVTRSGWHREPFVLASSQLMRRADRAHELFEDAEAYDLVVLDEAHHARRRGAGSPASKGPNQLLRLMRGLRERTQGLVLMTATPMQVDPIEVWDLLELLGLPSEWTAVAFLDFFEKAAAPNPSQADVEYLAYLFRSVETHFGEVSQEDALRVVAGSKLGASSVLKALRDDAKTVRGRLNAERRREAIKLMRANTPVARLVSRHTRGLLREYYQAGKISSRIADRHVRDEFVDMSDAERDVYEAVEEYISTTYNRASVKERNAVGFVMTVYRRRVASSFAALANTLERRLGSLSATSTVDEEDALDDERIDEPMDEEEAARLKHDALQTEERQEIAWLLDLVKKLPTDTKASVLLDKVRELREDGYSQVMVFTQYTDTMDFLRDLLPGQDGARVMCFSGRGGEVPNSDGTWRTISRDEVKRIFRGGDADVLVCTEAAAEGLNFQFCGALINYDMPWNPMRVEQRIGRIDRVGQQHQTIEIVNLLYKDTVEADVYNALRERIGLFSQYIGKAQPILATLPRAIATTILARRGEREREQAAVLSNIDEQVRVAEASPFDLDEATSDDLDEPVRPAPLYDLEALDRVLTRPGLLPPGVEAKPHGNGEYEFSMPGMSEPVRVTTNADYFEQQPESLELWSPGNPMFPELTDAAPLEAVAALELRKLLRAQK